MVGNNDQIIEAVNRNEVTAILLSLGYMVYKPEADVDGIDFIIKTPTDNILKCQLKSRSWVEWDRYGGKNIFMIFPGIGEVMKRDWYLVAHDKLFIIQKKQHGHANKWANKGGFWHSPVNPKLAELIKDYKIS